MKTFTCLSKNPNLNYKSRFIMIYNLTTFGILIMIPSIYSNWVKNISKAAIHGSVSIANCPDRLDVHSCLIEDHQGVENNKQMVIAPGQTFSCSIAFICELNNSVGDCKVNKNYIEPILKGTGLIQIKDPTVSQNRLKYRFQMGETGYPDKHWNLGFKRICISPFGKPFEKFESLIGGDIGDIATASSYLHCNKTDVLVKQGQAFDCYIKCVGVKASTSGNNISRSDQETTIRCTQSQFLIEIVELPEGKSIGRGDEKSGMIPADTRLDGDHLVFSVVPGNKVGARWSIEVYVTGGGGLTKGNRVLIKGSGENGIMVTNIASSADDTYGFVIFLVAILLIGFVLVCVLLGMSK